MLDAAVDEVARVGVELVHDVVVAASQDVLGIVRELDGRKASVLRREVLDRSAGLKIPQLGHTVSACRDEKIATELNSVDGAAVTLECANADTSLTVPDLDHGILAARDDVLVVQTDIQHTSFVATETIHGDILVASDVPDDAGVVRRAGDHDLVIILQAENGCVVVVRRNMVDAVACLAAIDRRVADDALRALLHGCRCVERRAVRRSAVDLDALVRLQIPHADRSIAGACDALVLVKLAAVDAVCVAIEIDSSGSASLPPLVDRASCRVHLFPVLRRRGLAVCLLANA